MKSKMRRIYAAVMALAITISLVTVPVQAAEAPQFSDVDGHWGEEAIVRWADNGVIEGSNGQFNPDAPITRAEMAAVIARLLGLTETAPNTFTDVEADAWYAQAILRCAAAGIIQGSNGMANPNGTLTRQEAAVMLGRALGIQPDEGDVAFLDGEQVAGWAAGYVSVMSDRGILNGVGGNQFAPLEDINRASVVTVLNNAVTAYANEPGATVQASGGIALVVAEDVTVTGTAEDVLIVAGGDVTVAADVSGSVTVSAEGAGVTVAENAVVGTVAVSGGSAAVTVEADASVSTLAVAESASGASVTVAADAAVETVTVAAPESSVTVSGSVGAVEAAETAGNADITVGAGATVDSITTAAAGTDITVSGTVETVTVAATAGETTVTANRGAEITSVDNSAEDVTVSGTGTVETVTTTGNNTAVNTNGTQLTVGEGVTGTTENNKKVDAGETTTTKRPSSGGGGSSSGGGSTGPTTSTVSGVTPAILADQTAGSTEALITNYNVTATQRSDRNYVDVAVAGTDLAYHQNANGAKGYWVGFAVAAPDSAAQMKYAFGTSQDSLTLGEAAALEANVTSDGKPGIAFYADLADASPKTWAQVQWLNGEGAAIGTTTYCMSLNVTVRSTVSSGEELSAAVAAGVTSVTLGDDVTVSGSLSVADLALNGKTLTIGDNVTLTVTGAITDAGTITGGTLVAPGYAKQDSNWVKLFNGGLGTEADPYEIANETQLKAVSCFGDAMAQNVGSHFVLTADITISSIDPVDDFSALWTHFAGVLDGDSHKITIGEGVSDFSYLALYTGTATFKNFTVDLNGTTFTVMAFADSNLEDIELTFSGLKFVSDETVRIINNNGLLAVYPNTSIINKVNNVTSITVDSCKNYVNLNGEGYGGVWFGDFAVGATKVTFKNTDNYGDMIGQFAGLFMGNAGGYGNGGGYTTDNVSKNLAIENCHNYGTLIGTTSATLFGYGSKNYQGLAQAEERYKNIHANGGSLTSREAGWSGMKLTVGEDKKLTIEAPTEGGITVSYYTINLKKMAYSEDNSRWGMVQLSHRYEPDSKSIATNDYGCIFVDVTTASNLGLTEVTDVAGTDNRYVVKEDSKGNVYYVFKEVDMNDTDSNSTVYYLKLQQGKNTEIVLTAYDETNTVVDTVTLKVADVVPTVVEP